MVVKSGCIFTLVTIKPHFTLSKRSVEILRKSENEFRGRLPNYCQKNRLSFRGTWLWDRRWAFWKGLSCQGEKWTVEQQVRLFQVIKKTINVLGVSSKKCFCHQTARQLQRLSTRLMLWNLWIIRISFSKFYISFTSSKNNLLLRYMNSWITGNYLFIQMEYCMNGTLHDAIYDRKGKHINLTLINTLYRL